MTIVQRIDKYYPGVWKLYEDLSEFAHPNTAGMGGIFTELDEAEREERVVDPWDDNGGALTYPFGALGMSLVMIDGAMRWLDETSMDLVRICEEDLYDRGEWPPRVPYRWKEKTSSGDVT